MGTDDPAYRIGYQGIAGAFSEGVALTWGARSGEAVSCATLAELFAALAAGVVDCAVVPVENSLFGPVPGAAELLERDQPRVLAERVVPIDQCLVGQAGADPRRLTEVWSHPVALGQCQRLFAASPWMVPVPWFDTAAAVRDALATGRTDVAAIGSAHAATKYGGVVLRERVQDRPDNTTRFLLVTSRSVDLSICRSFDLSIFRSVDLSICRSFDLSIFRSVDLSICRSFDLSIS
jgi:prephenate dehydratase